MLFGRHYISTMGYSQVTILIIFLTLKPYISPMSHPIKTIQCASLQENLTMTFSSYLQRTKLFWKAVSQRFRVLLLIATFSVLMMRVASPIWIHLIFPCYHKIVNSLYQIYQKWLTWAVLYQMFYHKNPDPRNFFHQIRNQTCFPHRMCPPQSIPFLDLCSKHQITTMYRAHLCPAPGRRLALRRPVWMKTTSQTYKACNHPHQSRKFYMTKQTQRNRVN